MVEMTSSVFPALLATSAPTPGRDFLSDVHLGLCYFEKSTYCAYAMKVFELVACSSTRLARPQGVTSIVHILSLYAPSLTMALHDCLLSAGSSHALMHLYM